MDNIHNKVLVLKAMLSNKEDMSIREIAKRAKIDYKAAYISLHRLKGIVSIVKKGNSSFCSIKQFNSEVFMAEEARRDEILKNPDLNILYNDLKYISPFFILLLFGSHASFKAAKSSDIDLMLIADDKEIVKKARSVLSRIPLKIHLLDFSSKEFSSMVSSSKFNVANEAVKNNVILFGIESYYGLLSILSQP